VYGDVAVSILQKPRRDGEAVMSLVIAWSLVHAAALLHAAALEMGNARGIYDSSCTN
jgi:hypothetical protein